MPNVFPLLDDFAPGTPDFGDWLVDWIPFHSSTFTAGALRFYTDPAVPIAYMDDHVVAATGDARCCLWRRAQQADVSVSVVFARVPFAGTVDSQHFTHAMVFARCQSQSVINPGSKDLYHQAGDCYAFEVDRIDPNTIRYRLVRYNGGIRTVLAFTDDPAGSIPANYTDPVNLTLTVKDVGGDPVLTGNVSGAAVDSGVGGFLLYKPGGTGIHGTSGAPGPGGTPLVIPSGSDAGGPIGFGTFSVDILTHTDTDALNKIQGSGRIGFGVNAPSEVPAASGNKSYTGLGVVQVADANTVALLLREEFSRVAHYLGHLVSLHGTGTAREGRSIYAGGASTLGLGTLIKNASAQAEHRTDLLLGGAVDFPGTTYPAFMLAPNLVFSIPPTPGSLAFSVAIWATLTENRDGNELYMARGLNSFTSLMEGFSFGVRTGAVGKAKVEVKLGGNGTATETTFQTAEFNETLFLNAATCFIMTYKARKSGSDGEVNVYLARGGATLFSETIVVPGTTQPAFPQLQTDIGDNHRIGHRSATAGAADQAKGQFDHVLVMYSELTAQQVAEVSSEMRDRESFLEAAYDLQMAAHFDTELVAPGGKAYKPWYPLGIGDEDYSSMWQHNDATASAVTGIVPSDRIRGVAIEMAPADDPVNQARSVQFTIPQSIGCAGIALRMTGNNGNQDDWTGYRVQIAPGSPGIIEVYRQEALTFPDSKATLLAKQPQSGAVNIATATTYKLDFSVVESTPGGAPLLQVEIDDVPVSLVAIPGSGASLDVDGNVLDFSGDAVMSGDMTGFYGARDPAGAHVALDDWDHQAATTPPGGAGGAGSYAFAAEDDGATGDLATAITPDWAVERRSTAPRREVEMESGHQARYVIGTYERRRFRLAKQGGSDAEIAALRSFWEAHRGAQIPFSWDPGLYLRDEPTGTFHFVADSLRDTIVGMARVTSVELEERRGTPVS